MTKDQILERLNDGTSNTLMQTLGMRFSDTGEDFLEASMPVGPRVHQPMGILHGGATAALAETVGSAASAMRVDLTDKTTNIASFSLTVGVRGKAPARRCSRPASSAGNAAHGRPQPSPEGAPDTPPARGVTLARRRDTMPSQACLAGERVRGSECGNIRGFISTTQSVVGLELAINHIRSAREGEITARAEAVHIGRSTHLWNIRIRDHNDRLIAQAKITMIVLGSVDSPHGRRVAAPNRARQGTRSEV